MTGRAQINLDGFMNGNAATGSGAFINFFKCYRINTPVEPDKQDDLGYPIASLGSDIAGQITVPPTMREASIQWVLKNTGTRQLRLLLDSNLTKVSQTGGVTVTGGSASPMTVSFSGLGRVVFTNDTVNATISTYFKSGGTFAPGTGELVLCRLSDESAYDAGSIYTPEFLAFLADANPKTIRLMPWNVRVVDNFTNESKWGYRVTPTTLSWVSARFPTGCWGGTVSGTNTYTIAAATDSPGSLTHGEVIQGTFTNASTGASTLDVGSRGTAKAIVTTTGAAIANGTISAGARATLIYHALLDAWIYQSGGITPSLPVEAATSLANSINAHLWLTIPFLMEDAAVSSLATAVAGSLNSSLTAYFEYHNEVWNFAFTATTLAEAMAAALGFPSGNNERNHGWYALRHRQMMGIITPIFASRGGLKRVMAFQASGGTSEIDTYRFKGTDLDTTKGYTRYNSYVGVSYSAAPNRPIDYADTLSYAIYYSGANFRNFDANFSAASQAVLETAANQYASGDAAQIATALAWLDDDIRQGLRSATLGSATLKNFNDTICPAWNALAVTYNLPVELYEGALEANAPSASRCTALGILVPPSSGTGAAANTALDGLLTTYKGQIYATLLLQDQFQQFMTNSKSLTPSQFVLLGPSQWALLPGDMFSAPYESYTAFKLFNARLRRLRLVAAP